MAGLTGPSGSWLLEGTDGDSGWRLVPVPASRVYRRFTAILPGLLAPAVERLSETAM